MMYQVVVQKIGVVYVEANSGLEAMRKANLENEENVRWDRDFEATDYEEVGD